MISISKFKKGDKVICSYTNWNSKPGIFITFPKYKQILTVRDYWLIPGCGNNIYYVFEEINNIYSSEGIEYCFDENGFRKYKGSKESIEFADEILQYILTEIKETYTIKN